MYYFVLFISDTTWALFDHALWMCFLMDVFDGMTAMVGWSWM